MNIQITDQIMFSFGFVKMKNYQKKKEGVSAFNWCLGTQQIFSIERDLCSDDDDIFYPVIRIFETIKYFRHAHQIKDFMLAFHEIDLSLYNSA